MSPNAINVRYCPSCHHESKSDDSLCPYCGETLRIRAYCATCQASWSLPVGEFCPKHDQELIDPAELDQGRGVEGLEETELVLVRSYSSAVEADAARLRLEAEGIPTFLDGERMGSTSFLGVATGGVKLKVPKSFESDTRILLAQSWSLPVDPETELEDAWDDMAPDPGARRRSIMKGLILVILFGPFVLWVSQVLVNLMMR